MREIISSIPIAFALLFLLTLVFTFVFTKIIPLNKIQLKKLDYIWLTLSAFAIFGLVEKNRIQLNEIELNGSKLFHEARINEIFYALDSNSICRRYIKTEFSPSNLEDIQKNTDSLCSWSKWFTVVIKEKIKNNDSINILVPFSNDEFFEFHTNNIQRVLDEYNNSLSVVLNHKKETQTNDFVFLIQLFSPIILILGLAIRFSKTASEIKLEDKSN